MRIGMRRIGIALAGLGLVGCVDDGGPRIPLGPVTAQHLAAEAPSAAIIRRLAEARGIGPLPSAPRVRPALSRLGQLLAFDKILSGNRDIACATCHLPAFGTGDGLSLSVGQGAFGLGPGRQHPAGDFIPRNAPPLFNLGAMQSLFWDGRIEAGPGGVIRTPAGAAITPEMARAFEFGPISALAMFPVTNRAEMRAVGGNELAAVPDNDPQQVWSLLMTRLGAIPEYRRLFAEAYPGQSFGQLSFAHASNAIAGFFVERLTLTGAPWDRFLAGDDRALTASQRTAAQTFLTLKCSICHNGPTFSDGQSHNVAVAQFGPGQGNGPSGRDDFGRMNVTGDPRDQYRFRTTPLRNVEVTGPWGHDGAILSLRGFIDHYSESDRKLRDFDPSTLPAALRGTLLPNVDAILATRDTLLNGVVLTAALVDQLTEFMLTLTDPAARRLDALTPGRVPSGLPVDRIQRR